MSDFYSVLKQSILDRSLSTPESREEAYEQARRAMINRLWAYDPPLTEDEIDHRIGQFDTAVARIEDDVVEAFAMMEPASLGADHEVRVRADDDRYAPLGGTGDEDGYDYDPHADEDLPELRPIPSALRALDERSRAIEQALQESDDDPVESPPREAAAYDEDLAGWSGPEVAANDHDAEEFADDAPPSPAPASLPRRSPPEAKPKPRPKATLGPRPAPHAGRAKATSRVPAGRPSRLGLLIGAVAILAVLFVGGLVWLLLPRLAPPVASRVVLQTEVPGGVSDPDTAIRLPKEAIAVTSSFSLFDGKDPTVFAGDSDNPVRFDGELARIATSTSSAGAKVIIGAGLSSRLAGRTIRVTLEARSARENGASSMRFAYQSGVAISHWQTANLSPEFTPLGLVWRVPALRTSPTGDYLVIEPGIPGSGTGVEIKTVRIDLVDQ